MWELQRKCITEKLFSIAVNGCVWMLCSHKLIDEP